MKDSSSGVLTPPPVLTSERLLVRPLTPGDLEDCGRLLTEIGWDVQGIAAREMAERRRTWLQWTIASYREFPRLQQPVYGERAVERRADGAMIGMVGLVPSFGPFAQLPCSAAGRARATRPRWVYSGRFGPAPKGRARHRGGAPLPRPHHRRPQPRPRGGDHRARQRPLDRCDAATGHARRSKPLARAGLVPSGGRLPAGGRRAGTDLPARERSGERPQMGVSGEALERRGGEVSVNGVARRIGWAGGTALALFLTQAIAAGAKTSNAAPGDWRTAVMAATRAYDAGRCEEALPALRNLADDPAFREAPEKLLLLIWDIGVDCAARANLLEEAFRYAVTRRSSCRCFQDGVDRKDPGRNDVALSSIIL